MIVISCREQRMLYSAFHLLQAFFPEQELEQHLIPEQEPTVQIIFGQGSCFSLVNKTILSRYEVLGKLYDFLAKRCDKKLSWGVITGVRPGKLVEKLAKEHAREDIEAILIERYRLDAAKARLLMQVMAQNEQVDHGGYSLYVGIPFCPSICSYCSFGSALLSHFEHLVEPYITALIEELKEIARVYQDISLRTIYIGGGIPTALPVAVLARLLQAIDRYFSSKNLVEYTLEMGRPDTITAEILAVVKAHPITRISINPQTMQGRTLAAIGRQHTPQEVHEAYALARQWGFHNINMDLILGLPGESVPDVVATMDQVIALQPDSVTIHCLATKRKAQDGQARFLKKGYGSLPQQSSSDMAAMLDLAQETAAQLQMHPYYLYRQKSIAGNFENVGYATVDKEGIYNILIIEDRHLIIGAGAGAGSKIVAQNKIWRYENPKNIEIYLEKRAEVWARHQQRREKYGTETKAGNRHERYYARGNGDS